MNKSTKICPKCGCDQMSKLHGEDKKLCTGCGHELEWPLEEGQKSLFKPNVVGAVDEKGNPIPFALYASDMVVKPFRVSDGELYSMGQKTPETQAAYQKAVTACTSMPSLHDQIMRIECKPRPAEELIFEDSHKLAYAMGHRDARHAAAELSNGYDALAQRCKGLEADCMRLAEGLNKLGDERVATVTRLLGERDALRSALKGLLEFAVYDEEKTDECIAAVKNARDLLL